MHGKKIILKNSIAKLFFKNCLICLYLYIKNAYLFQPNKKAKIVDIDLKTSDAIIHQKEGDNQGDNENHVTVCLNQN